MKQQWIGTVVNILRKKNKKLARNYNYVTIAIESTTLDFKESEDILIEYEPQK